MFSEPLNTFSANNQRIKQIKTGILTGSVLELKGVYRFKIAVFGGHFVRMGVRTYVPEYPQLYPQLYLQPHF